MTMTSNVGRERSLIHEAAKYGKVCAFDHQFLHVFNPNIILQDHITVYRHLSKRMILENSLNFDASTLLNLKSGLTFWKKHTKILCHFTSNVSSEKLDYFSKLQVTSLLITIKSQLTMETFLLQKCPLNKLFSAIESWNKCILQWLFYPDAKSILEIVILLQGL